MVNSEQDDERADLTDFALKSKAATSAVTKPSMSQVDCIETTYELDC
ncbi:hypothetical protein [Pseudomonas sp. MH9.3]|nr:hypothetical protein [Pseudomonas sp. MH9.3]MEB0109025.1 hypothetical protein [Pseudomonas sp. MH9.3]WPX81727.1 hypothetical protein RHM60_11645 [Pseudomonas sp. MH9.3]